MANEEDNWLLEDDDEQLTDKIKPRCKTSSPKPSKLLGLALTTGKVLMVALGMISAFIVGMSAADVKPCPSTGNRHEAATAAACLSNQQNQWSQSEIRKMLGKDRPPTAAHVEKKPLKPPPGVESLGKCPPDYRAAKVQGCVYDLVLSSWMHPACFNASMHERYLSYYALRNISLWREPARVNQVTIAEAATGEHGDLWGEGLIHHIHCAYVLERLITAFRNRTGGGRPAVDTLAWDDDHIHHCNMYNGLPLPWEIGAPNVTRVYNEPYDIDCWLG